MAEAEAKWYVVHTYSGYENKVKLDIEKTIANNKNIADKILGVEVPTESVMEVKDGKKKVVDRKMCPGYVIVHMVMTDNTWYIVRNTRGVTGFVGPGSKPVPLTEEELINLGIGKPQPGMGNEEKAPKRDYGIKVGDLIAVVDGTWRDTEGKALKIDDSKQTVTINVEMFGRETPLEVPLDNVRRMG